MPAPLIGIFVGGASSRMGRAKGLLPAPDGSASLVQRLWRLAELAGPACPRFLVGRRQEYEELRLATVEDAVAERGPLGGIVALLEEAKRQAVSSAVVVACDLPYLSAELLGRLVSEEESGLLAPRVDERFQPLFARYPVSLLPEFRLALEQERLALQPLLRAHARVLELSAAEKLQLRDWDRPEDIPGGC